MIRLVAAGAAAAVLSLPALRAQEIDVAGMLTAYAEGQHDAAVARAAALPDLGPFRLRYVQDAPRWVNADPARIAGRRAAAAAFLLELTAARLESDWGRLSDLIENTCMQMRTAGPPAPFEREWHAASHGLAGRARARVWLLGEYARLPHQKPTAAPPSDPQRPPARHLMHALERFPDDPQFQLSRVVAWTWGRDGEPIRNVRRREDSERRPTRRAPQMEAVVTLELLTAIPAVAAEAWLHIGRVHFTVQDYASALRAFESAQPIASPPSVKYLGHLNAGRALEHLSRPDDAAIEYRKALDVVPGAESATVALASLQFMQDDRDRAVSSIDRVFDRVRPGADPGRLIGYGSFMHWPELKAAMRKALPQ